MSIDTPEELRCLFLEFAKASKIYVETDYYTATKLALVLQDFLEKEVGVLARSFPSAPASQSYQCDGTSYLTLCAEPSNVGGIAIVRDGRTLTQFLVERGFILVLRGSGEIKSKLILRIPRLLLKGKTAWHSFTASCEFMTPIRGFGRTGIVVTHVAFDRAEHDCLSRRFSGKNEIMSLGNDSEEHNIAELDWFVATADPYHDIQNAYHKGMSPYNHDGLVKEFYIVVQSIINGYSDVSRMIRPFLCSCWKWREEDAADLESVRAYWMRVGVAVDMLEMFVTCRCFRKS